MVAAFILCCLIGYYLLDSLAKILNVKNLGDQVPAEFAGIYEPDRYRESQRYLPMKTGFELVAATVPVFSLAGRAVTGRHFGLLSQTSIPAPRPSRHRRLASFIEGKCLFYRLR